MIYCDAVHGFLGNPQDWTRSFATALPEFQLDYCFDLFAQTDAQSLAELGARLRNQSLTATRSGPRVLVGYSLGGRAALHALLAGAGPWDAAVIISAHPGLTKDQDARVKSDEQWAKRFERDAWPTLVEDWNSQSVFAGDPPQAEPPRVEGTPPRAALAHALRHWSLGQQADLRIKLSVLNIPILWVAGQKDARYATLAHECAELNPLFKSQIIPDCGHRVPWANPGAMHAAIFDFVRDLTSKRRSA